MAKNTGRGSASAKATQTGSVGVFVTAKANGGRLKPHRKGRG